MRRAGPGDLSAIYDVWYRNQVRGDDDPPEPGDPSVFAHELATGTVVVASDQETIVGFAAVLDRGDVAYLAELFVAPDHQSSGVGRELLTEVLGDRGGVICTMSSGDPRALPLYVRAGMQPRWPGFWLVGASRDLKSLGSEEVTAAKAGDLGEIVAWDTEVSGRPRPVDHAYWTQHEQGVALSLNRNRVRVGYGYARMRSPVALHNPDAATLGPIGVRDPTDAASGVAAVVAWAAERAPEVRLSIPGPHPALRVLLEAGMHITETEIFLSTDPVPLDPQRYLTSGDQL